MSKRFRILAATLVVIAGATTLLTAADVAGPGKYQVVANWLKLPPDVKLGGVTAVDVDDADRVYVFHRSKPPILVFDKDGKFLRSLGDGLVKTAHGLRVDRDGYIWITDIGTHLVTKLDAAGKVLMTLGKKNQPGSGNDQFNMPADAVVARTGEIYVADGYGNSRVVKFTKDGKFVTSWGKKGKGPGEFNLPHTICFDAKGRICVGDRENNRVQVFDTGGKFLEEWKESGSPFGLFPKGDQLFVADGRGKQVRILDLAGKVVARWGEKGTQPGQFATPHGICVDSTGAVYVGEVDGKRVQKFVAK